MMLLMGRKPRKEAKKREEMLSNLKKGDRITTIGGIVGTIMEIKDQEITIKVDESTNARMRVARWSVRDIGTPTEQAQSEEKKK
jgi:preprotein translocase subunit YajC